MMSNRSRERPSCAVAWLACLLLTSHATVHADERAPVATSSVFAFHNDRDTNLNDALIAAGVARNFDRDELFAAGPEAACFEALAPSMQLGWDLAVQFYTQIISPNEFSDRQQYFVRLQLAGMLDKAPDERLAQYLDQVSSIRGAALPAYVACRWPAQKARNEAWIDDLLPLLEQYEREIAGRLEKLYRKSWDGARVDIDVVETVNWAGANSVFPRESGGHVLISTASSGHASLETVFHEASHGFMLIGDPLRADLATAAEELGVARPAGLWHVALFHTTGDTVSKVLAAADEPGYTPMIYEIYERSDWVAYRESFAEFWPDVIDGRRAPADAARDLLRKISEAD